MNADIRIYPDKEMKAIDMAVILDALEVSDGVIQGCEVSLTSGALSISDGRILIKGRLGVVTAGTIEIPTLAASATCSLLAVCDLAIDSPFYISLFSAEEYAVLVERANSVIDFNGTNGVAFVELGTAEVDASTGTVTSWSANAKASAFRAMKPYFERMGGNYLPAGSNIDTLTKDFSGWWTYKRADVSGTFIVNDTAGMIGHAQGADSNTAMQILRSGGQSAANRTFFVRYKVNGVWGAWQNITNSTLTPMTINLTQNNYCTYTDVTTMHAYRKGGWLWLKGNLHVTHPVPQGTTAQIGTITGWIAPVSSFVNVPERSGKSVLTITLSYDGKLSITNNSPYQEPSGSSGYYNFLIMAPSNDGQ